MMGTLKRRPSPRGGIVVSIYLEGTKFCRGKQAAGTRGLLTSYQGADRPNYPVINYCDRDWLLSWTN